MGEGRERKEVSISLLYFLFAFLFSFPPETPRVSQFASK